MLDRDTILSKKTLRREKITVEDWGGEILVRELTGRERAVYEAGFTDTVAGDIKEQNPREKAKRFEDMRAKLIVMASINEDGSRLFLDDDVAVINELSGSALDKVASVIMRLSGYSPDEQARLKKNSQAGDVSTTGSPLH